MHSNLTHLPINWKNGMAFSADHLSEQHLAVIEGIKDTAALHLNSFNYGLLKAGNQMRFANSIADNSNNEKVELPYCRAITQNGSRIEILHQNWEELSIPLLELIDSKSLSTSKFWYVLLVIDPFIRIPEGIESEQESPRRKPSTRPAYQLELVSLDELTRDSLANAIPIAKYQTSPSGAELRKIAAYIPPCMSISSHEKLIEKYDAFDRYLASLNKSALAIIKTIKAKRRTREQNHLAEDIESLCQKYMEYFVLNYDEYKLTFKDLPPVKLVEFFARLARTLNHTMDMAHDKNHLLQYFEQYASSTSVAELNTIFRSTCELKYTHYDTLNALLIVDKFLLTLSEILTALEDLNYRDLAPVHVVQRDNIVTQNQPIQRQRPVQRKTGERTIRIKHSGKERHIGDELD